MTGVNKPQLDQDIKLFTQYIQELVGVYKINLNSPGWDPEMTTLELCAFLVETYNVYQLASMVAVATGMLAKGGVPDVEVLPGV